MVRLPARLWLLALLLAWGAAAAAESLIVGSKRFTESYILGEILRQSAAGTGEAEAVHRPGLGNTGIVFAALASGSIDLYPEYTGTIAREILKDAGAATLAEINRRLAPLGLGAAVPLGFENTYGLALREEQAQALRLARISDLAGHPGLRLGLSQEFLGRADGWAGLQRAYALPFATPRGLDHGLAYEALAAGQVDVVDVYTTDAKIVKYGLRVLEDDRGYFPAYEAVLLYRLELPRRLPRTWAALARLEGRLSPARMVALNAQAELEGRSFAEVAAGFLAGPDAAAARRFLDVLFGADLPRLTFEHLLLVFVSLAAAVALGLPLGIGAAYVPGLRQPVLAAVGLIQTIPSLALLAFLIPALEHIGTLPALVALFLYALLPIVRNTYTGLTDIPAPLAESARALGLSAAARLRLIELPLASRAILAGIKTAAVINVGTATIAAFIGAGGYGERIAAGLALNDHTLLLAGALPAAVLALVVQGVFELAERWLVPTGLRKQAGRRA